MSCRNDVHYASCLRGCNPSGFYLHMFQNKYLDWIYLPDVDRVCIPKCSRHLAAVAMNYTRRSINCSLEQAALGSGKLVFVASIYSTLFLENRTCTIGPWILQEFCWFHIMWITTSLVDKTGKFLEVRTLSLSCWSYVYHMSCWNDVHAQCWIHSFNFSLINVDPIPSSTDESAKCGSSTHISDVSDTWII